MKHIPIAIIYGFLSLISFVGTDLSNVGFPAVSILLSWIILFALIYSIQWFDHVTDIYFIIVILLFLASRMARYNAPEITKPATYIAIGVGMGLVAECCYKGHMWPIIFLLSIFSLEIVNMELDTEWTANISNTILGN